MDELATSGQSASSDMDAGPSHTTQSRYIPTHHDTRSPDVGEMLVSIKCPSLDQDSTLIKFKPDDTILHVKQTIESTWPGAPKAKGMRCIRAGRLLQDQDVLRDMATTLQPHQHLSLHLVIRPDAWSDPQNRPTPSRRSSFTRQQAARASALQAQASLNTYHDPSPPEFGPYFSDPIEPPSPESLDDAVKPLPYLATPQETAEACSRLEQTIRITAPENYPILTDALTRAYDEYLLLYEDIYNASFQAQGDSGTVSTDIQATRDVLDLVEEPLFGWSPIDLTAASTNAASGDDKPYYRQITHQGLPYLLRMTASPLALQRSEALSQLLTRMSALRIMLRKVENLTLLGSLVQPSAPTANAAVPPTDTTSPAAQQRPLSRWQILTTMLRRTRASIDQITYRDLAEVTVHIFFLVLRVSMLLYLVIRHADPLKKFFVLGMSAVYIAFESWRILLRRVRARHPAPAAAPPLNRPTTPVPPPVNPHVNPEPPLGSNVPHASSPEEQDVDRQVAEEPLRALPPPRSPPRNRAASTLTLDYLIEHMAFIGLDLEDAELGMPPANGSAARPIPQRGFWQKTCYSLLLPLLLFFFTMVPEVEQRRKHAIQERERVVRKWTRLEQERRQNIQNLNQSQDILSDTGVDDELLGRRKAYSDQILRQRTGGAANASGSDTVDADDEDAIQQVLREPEQDDMQLNFF